MPEDPVEAPDFLTRESAQKVVSDAIAPLSDTVSSLTDAVRELAMHIVKFPGKLATSPAGEVASVPEKALDVAEPPLESAAAIPKEELSVPASTETPKSRPRHHMTRRRT